MAEFSKRYVFLSFCVLSLLVIATALWNFGKQNDYHDRFRIRIRENSSSVKVVRKVPHFHKRLNGTGVLLDIHPELGLGNQLFQYACAHALARERNATLYNSIPGQRTGPKDREYLLSKFQLPLTDLIDKTTRINPSSVKDVLDPELLFKNYSYHPSNRTFPLLRMTQATYCQSPMYWMDYKEELLPMFRLKPEVVQKFPPYVTSLEKEIGQAGESVAVHVRRGDFLIYPGYYIPISYQRAAIRRLIKILQERRTSSPPKFFVFSDDINYARRNLHDLASEGHDFIFVSYFPDGLGNRTRTTTIQDFFLMTRCKHLIIPNSTFSWWAAYLATNWKGSSGLPEAERIVIASAFNEKFWKLWKGKEEDFYRLLYGRLHHPKEWIVINTFEGEH